MAVALDASTPARWSGTPAEGAAITSGAFTAPANALLVTVVEYDSVISNGATQAVSDSGGLTWATQVVRSGTETTAGGTTQIHTARTTSATSRTVSVTRGVGSGNSRLSAACYVFTGVDVDGTPVDTVGASNEGGSGTNNLATTSVTPGADGVLVVAGCEWNALGACTSSDLKGVDGIAGSSHAEYAGAIDVIDGWKPCSSGVGVTGNLDAAAGTPQWKWCQIVVRAPASGAAFLPRPNARPDQAVKRAALW